jgi:hypothetical protein
MLGNRMLLRIRGPDNRPTVCDGCVRATITFYSLHNASFYPYCLLSHTFLAQ